VSSSQQDLNTPRGYRRDARASSVPAARDLQDFKAFVKRLAAERPPFFRALASDALIFAYHRGEQARVQSKLGRWLYFLRLPFVASEFLALELYRLRVVLRAWHVPLLPTLINWTCAICWGFRVGDHVTIDEGVYLPHGQIDIEGLTYIGTGCYLSPFVGIGLVQGDIRGPRVEGYVFIGTGVKILGHRQIGHGAQLGANAVVLIDVPPGATAVGVPARVLQVDNDASSNRGDPTCAPS
jgi:serine O-acetyltransferase